MRRPIERAALAALGIVCSAGVARAEGAAPDPAKRVDGSAEVSADKGATEAPPPQVSSVNKRVSVEVGGYQDSVAVSVLTPSLAAGAEWTCSFDCGTPPPPDTRRPIEQARPPEREPRRRR